MKKNFLLPPLFKKIGLWMVLPFLVLSVLCVLELEILPDVGLYMKMPALVDGYGERNWFCFAETDIIDEFSMLGLLVSLVFIALSREYDEDEMTTTIRMGSFVWSAWASSIVLSIGILFVFGIDFLLVGFLAMYLFLALYIIKFNYTMSIERKNRYEE